MKLFSTRTTQMRLNLFVLLVYFLSSAALGEKPEADSLDQELVLKNDVVPLRQPPVERALSESFFSSEVSYSPHDPKVYISSRRDRSGSVILQMLKAHAWAFSRNFTYWGMCETEIKVRATKKYKQMELLQALGLADTLPYNCPPQDGEGTLEYHFLDLGRKISAYRVERTPEWLNYIQSRVTYPPSRDKALPKRAVVHIRRGDVNPCRQRFARTRYLPNWYYKELVKRYVPEDYDIVIYSELYSFEPWSDFSNDMSRNYQLRLSSSVAEAWVDFMTADILIDSRSNFSVVPAMLNRHGNVIHASKHGLSDLPPHWTLVDEELINRAVSWNIEQSKRGDCWEILRQAKHDARHARSARNTRNAENIS